jgi:hypothetical protein
MSEPLLALLSFLLVIAAPALANAPSPDGGETVTVHDFATLTLHEALALRGHPARYSFVVDSAPELVDDYLAFDCTSPAGESRTVYLLPGRVPTERMNVEGVLEVRQMPPAVGPGGTFFPGFTELRLLAARRCR